MCTSATASGPSTASTPRCTTSRPGCRTPPAYLIATEVGVLKKLTEEVQRPYVVILGGAKVSDKLGVIDQLLGKADRILIGGGMAYTFLKAKGHEVGISLLQEDQIPTVTEYMERAEKNGVELVLPVDILASGEFPT